MVQSIQTSFVHVHQYVVNYFHSCCHYAFNMNLKDSVKSLSQWHNVKFLKQTLLSGVKLFLSSKCPGVCIIIFFLHMFATCMTCVTCILLLLTASLH